ncbi:uncharacterized protein EDB91DRAFT_1088835 [Suillus paluster]|uniref:uncharacterized protein n=1 Tax=Suillus paluster TaxID=48578 RepID=UPI001B86CE7C|nr:uncharacterized protein EDB91DRAFT_1088835 [Suillus paluster]KAG1720459.1 hypothetical protein EDB91DRAFT_1088835 [Suillus paluster]
MSETQRHIHIEQEDIQTATDTYLFDEDNNMEYDESQTTSQFDTPQCTMASIVSGEASQMNLKECFNDVTGQPSTWTTRLGKRGTSRMDLDNVTGQPPTAPLDKREKRVTNPVLPDKCRIKEVDCSETLRTTMYSQKQLINNMRMEVENQQVEHVCNINDMKQQLAKAHDEIRRTHVQQQQLEEHIKETREALGQGNHEAIKATMQKIQEDAHDYLAQEWAWQEAELNEKLIQHEEELKRKTNEESQERENATFAEMDRRSQQEVLKLKAEKESELAKMEWRFSRVHLVSLVAEVDEEEVPQEHSSEQDAPPHLQHDTPPATTMEDAIARGVEAALRCVLIDKEFPVIKKHSPWRRKTEEKELQQEKVAEKSYERDFFLASQKVVRKLRLTVMYRAKCGVSSKMFSTFLKTPISYSIRQLVVRMSTHMNMKTAQVPITKISPLISNVGPKAPGTIKSLACCLKNCGEGVTKRAGHSEVWTAAQPKVTTKGGLETLAEVEQRLISEKDKTLKATRQTTRRKNKYLHRVKVLDHLVKYQTDENEENLPAWQWLQQLVGTLGEDGMSSEESNVENDIETVLRVKNMTWCRAIKWELDIIDHQRIMDDDIFAPQGSKPMKWICSARNPTTSRKEGDGLPKALYNEEWLAGLTKCQVEGLSISDGRFKWMRVAVV